MLTKRKRIGQTKRVFILFFLVIVVAVNLSFGGDWRTADRSSANIAPNPAETSDAIVQVYAARTFGWRGLFAVHTWIATKAEAATEYNVYQVLGWRKWRGLSVVYKAPEIPDRMWFGNQPELLQEIRGTDAIPVITAIESAASSYPYENIYRIWPGPNSNTFTAYIARNVPQLRLDLPPTAIGKDYMADKKFIDTAPSGDGVQLSFYGLLGGLFSRIEGIELNILSLNFGLKYTPEQTLPIKLRLPLLGITPNQTVLNN